MRRVAREPVLACSRAVANARSNSGSAASLSPDERRSRPRSRSTRTRTRGDSSVTSSSSRSPAVKSSRMPWMRASWVCTSAARARNRVSLASRSSKSQYGRSGSVTLIDLPSHTERRREPSSSGLLRAPDRTPRTPSAVGRSASSRSWCGASSGGQAMSFASSIASAAPISVAERSNSPRSRRDRRQPGDGERLDELVADPLGDLERLARRGPRPHRGSRAGARPC